DFKSSKSSFSLVLWYSGCLKTVRSIGVMEGINNRIKLIMRQGYGFSNFDNFRERVLACFSN
ncbi:transposase, partial [Microcoleus sp. Pol14C6]